MLKVSRAPHARRFAARDDRFPGQVGYGDSPDDAVRDLEDKLPRRAPPEPVALQPTTLLPLSPAHGLFALDRLESGRLEAARLESGRPEPGRLELGPRTIDALDRAFRVGNFESNRRRH